MGNRYSEIQFPVFAFRPGAQLWVDGVHAPFPRHWFHRITAAWRGRPGYKPQWESLPTRSLVDQLLAADTRIIYASSDLEADDWLWARGPIDLEVVRLVLEAWILSEVAPHEADFPWYYFLSTTELEWRPHRLDLARQDLYLNGTSWPSDSTFRVLPSLLAAHIADHGLRLRGVDRQLVLGPANSDGRRRAYVWPPAYLEDQEADGYWTPYIEFHCQTAPTEPDLRIHAELHMARFAARPPKYIPNKGRRSAHLALLVLADTKYLHGQERPTLLYAPLAAHKEDDGYKYRWQPSVARVAARLEQRHVFPDPDQVCGEPAAHLMGTPAAVVLHATGITYQLPATPENSSTTASSPKKTKQAAGKAGDAGPAERTSTDHPANPGFQPTDHIEVFEQLQPGLALLGIHPTAPRPCADTRAKALLTPPPRPERTFPLNLWTSSPRTREAVVTALTDRLGFTAQPHSDDGILTYRADVTVRLAFHDAGSLMGGLPRPDSEDKAERKRLRDAARAERAADLVQAFGHAPSLQACIVEMEGADHFSRTGKGDPKSLVKQTLPTLNQRVQCLRPVTKKGTPDGKKGNATYEDTDFRKDDIERATSAILDAMRQVGYIPDLPAPLGIDGPFEVSTIWIGQSSRGVVPMLLRAHTSGELTAQLMSTPQHPHEPEMDLLKLPEALVQGRGRITFGQQRGEFVSFLKHALALDSTAPRLFLARAARLKNADIWPWLQDRYITPDALLLPGVDPTKTTSTARKPGDCPGLRIIRVREGATGEVSRGFGVTLDAPLADTQDNETEAQLRYGRFSGLVEINARTFIGINPRSAQNQLPLKVTKLDPADTRAARHQCSNPSSLELYTAFLQDGDQPADFGMYVQALRRYYSHTAIDTELPHLMHFGELMQEYIP